METTVLGASLPHERLAAGGGGGGGRPAAVRRLSIQHVCTGVVALLVYPAYVVVRRGVGVLTRGCVTQAAARQTPVLDTGGPRPDRCRCNGGSVRWAWATTLIVLVGAFLFVTFFSASPAPPTHAMASPPAIHVMCDLPRRRSGAWTPTPVESVLLPMPYQVEPRVGASQQPHVFAAMLVLNVVLRSDDAAGRDAVRLVEHAASRFCQAAQERLASVGANSSMREADSPWQHAQVITSINVSLDPSVVTAVEVRPMSGNDTLRFRDAEHVPVFPVEESYLITFHNTSVDLRSRTVWGLMGYAAHVAVVPLPELRSTGHAAPCD